MFDLKTAISNWRKDLAHNESLSPTDIDEMQNHLSDEINNLTEMTLSEEEAFLIATRRLGDSTSIAAEFAKVNCGAG